MFRRKKDAEELSCGFEDNLIVEHCFCYPSYRSSSGFLSGNDFYAGQTASIGRTRQVNSDRIKRNTQIFDLWKAAVKIREPLAQRYLATVRRCTFAYEISLARETKRNKIKKNF